MKLRSLFFRMVLMLSVILSLTAYFSLSTIQAASWLGGWANRIALTIDHTKVSSDLVNFPLLVHLSSASGINQANVANLFTSLGTNSKKLAITTSDGLSQCYTEIAKWDTASQQADLWVKVPSLSSSTDTTLYLYYDNLQPDNLAYVGGVGSPAGQNVWDSNYVAVYHFSEQGQGISGEYKDSTSHQHHGTSTGDLPPTRSTDSPTGYSQVFDGPSYEWTGHNRLITVPDADDFSVATTNQLTIEYWMKPTAWNMPGNDNVPPQSGEGRLGIFGKSYSGGNDEWIINLHNNAATSASSQPGLNTFYVYALDGQMGHGTGMPEDHGWDTSWQWMVAQTNYTGDDATSYSNSRYSEGSQVLVNTHGGVAYYNSNSLSNGSWAPGNGSAPVEIGGMTHYTSTPISYFTGLFAEIRFSNIYRGDSWLKADYYSQTDNLVSFGSPVTNTTPPSPISIPAPIASLTLPSAPGPTTTFIPIMMSVG